MSEPTTPTPIAAPTPIATTVTLADGGTLTIQEPAKPATASEALDAWFKQYVPNSAISRNTGAYNAVLSSVNQIKAALATVKE